MIVVTLDQIHERAKKRPDGYVEDVLAHAFRIDGEDVFIDDDNYAKLLAKYNPPPSGIEMAGSLVNSLATWVGNGAGLVTDAVFDARLAVCKGCEFWNPTSFNKTGRCMKCGCATRAKLRMSTEKCPIDKWGPEDNFYEHDNTNDHA